MIIIPEYKFNDFYGKLLKQGTIELEISYAVFCFRLFWCVEVWNKSCQVWGQTTMTHPNPLITKQYPILRNQFNEEEY